MLKSCLLITVTIILLIKTAVGETFDKKITIFTTKNNSSYDTNLYQNFDLIEISKSTLLDTLKNYEYRLIDGDKILKDKRANFKRSNTEIIKNYELINQLIESDIMIMFNFKIFTDNYDTKYMQISSDIFDTKIKSFVNSWSVPIKKIQIPKNCDRICEKTILVEDAIILSSRLGDDIGNYLKSIFADEKQLEAYSNKYIIKMLGLKKNNSEIILDLLINEFPGYIELQENIKNNFQRWIYFSSAKHEKIIYWFKSVVRRINSNNNNLKLKFKNKEIIIQN
tara:strand:- start:309 stop:1151 length:843 start_codon:yes stop_codon:yes gene_type:complete